MDLVQGAQAFQILAAHLKETGEGGLRRDLTRAIRDAAQPVAAEIGNISNLNEHMPDRYAGVLAASLKVTTRARAGGTGGGITIFARAPTVGGGGRRIGQRNEGVLGHPVFGRRSAANPRRWASWEYQADGMRPGFFSDPCHRGAPRVRAAVLEAMRRTCEQITKRT